MKEYHTEIEIAAPLSQVWAALLDVSKYPEWNPLVGWMRGDVREGGRVEMFIKPLGRAFSATIDKLEAERELSWLGVLGARWIVYGHHYYRLEAIGEDATRLHHGEVFGGLGSLFISRSLLAKMEQSFREHNEALERLIEEA